MGPVDKKPAWHSKRFSDRPTERGGPFLRICTLVFATLGGGVVGVLTVHILIAKTIGKGYLILGPGVAHFTLFNLICFIVGAVIGLTTAWRAWNEASRDD